MSSSGPCNMFISGSKLGSVHPLCQTTVCASGDISSLPFKDHPLRRVSRQADEKNSNKPKCQECELDFHPDCALINEESELVLSRCVSTQFKFSTLLYLSCALTSVKGCAWIF